MTCTGRAAAPIAPNGRAAMPACMSLTTSPPAISSSPASSLSPLISALRTDPPVPATVEYSGVARIATWNLWWRFGPWRERRRGISHVLREANPDICGLQEVWAEDERNLAGELAEELGMHWSWTASPEPERWRARAPDERAGAGTAILSRWPIAHGFDVPLPAASSGDGGRTATMAVV